MQLHYSESDETKEPLRRIVREFKIAKRKKKSKETFHQKARARADSAADKQPANDPRLCNGRKREG